MQRNTMNLYQETHQMRQIQFNWANGFQDGRFLLGIGRILSQSAIIVWKTAPEVLFLQKLIPSKL
jgi:hypothetical protein